MCLHSPLSANFRCIRSWGQLRSLSIVVMVVFFCVLFTDVFRWAKMLQTLRATHWARVPSPIFSMPPIYSKVVNSVLTSLPCTEIVCWKVQLVDRILRVFSSPEKKFVNTGMFEECFHQNCASNLVVFACSAHFDFSTLDSGSRILLKQGDICCAEAKMSNSTKLPSRLVFITMGHDNLGSPVTPHPTHQGNQFQCFEGLLGMSCVEKYFVSQHKSAYQHSKLDFLPIGLGPSSSRLKVGISQQTLLLTLQEVKESLLAGSVRKECIVKDVAVNANLFGRISGRYRQWAYSQMCILFGTVPNLYQIAIGRPMIRDYALSTFVFSPKGTHFDCWRHYEALVSGSIPLIDEHHSLVGIFHNLPVVSLQNWSALNGGSLEGLLTDFFSRQYFNLEKLSDCYWLSQVGLKMASSKCAREFWLSPNVTSYQAI